MNCSDNVSSDAVLPKENISFSRQTGMGYARVNKFLLMMKWNGNDLIVVYEPNAASWNIFTDSLVVSPSCEYTGRDK
ncbi:hypothetical protein RZQ20_25540 [Raoultella ornithinolytica]|uniref:hypothetical protein n=1 Tax=Raoultella ornithinolytica TaxID=54291 RepID=UPI00255B2C38|nr:hypothetical protein [Raoultella ornithinolytica]MDL4585331.1 hypothetical protein [Raoultella ornithinolytica]MDV1095629.1 hypothetical protein [Raoultella ornithinolytica]MDV1123180.1 hypothetical protein [Raoultella ornithinolytica]MDV1893540.1 hypothetical protein [Raoultella ornithinolytica]HEC2564895.1 hypothetical protein [Raoultella ornithinolytica]